MHRMPGWGDLPSEAFEQRHEIKEGGREEDLLAGEEGEGAMQTVTVEDKTSDVVVWGVHGQDTRPSWSCGAVTADTLTWLAEQGDVQNAVDTHLLFHPLILVCTSIILRSACILHFLEVVMGEQERKGFEDW